MEKNKSAKAKRAGYYSAAGLMMISALLYWIAGIGTVFALCMASAGLCFFAAGLSVKTK